MTREQILNLGAPSGPATIDIPDWGGEFELLPLTGEQSEEVALRMEAYVRTNDPAVLKGLRARVAIWTIARSGKPVFTEADIDALSRQHAVLFLILQRVLHVNGLAKDTAPQVAEDLAKN
jgi:hypothetical protein